MEAEREVYSLEGTRWMRIRWTDEREDKRKGCFYLDRGVGVWYKIKCKRIKTNTDLLSSTLCIRVPFPLQLALLIYITPSWPFLVDNKEWICMCQAIYILVCVYDLRLTQLSHVFTLQNHVHYLQTNKVLSDTHCLFFFWYRHSLSFYMHSLMKFKHLLYINNPCMLMCENNGWVWSNMYY